MKAAVFHGPGKPLTIEEIQIDEPREHEVLVRTVATGVCHSDLHFVEGLYPHPSPAVLGHEAAGIVEQVGGGHLPEARRSRDLVPLGLLRSLRALHRAIRTAARTAPRSGAPRTTSRGCPRTA